MTPTRETFGNIPHASVVLFYCLTVVVMVVFVYGIWRRFRLWRRGLPINARALVAGNLASTLLEWRQLQTNAAAGEEIGGEATEPAA